jgi:hypothetical protein
MNGMEQPDLWRRSQGKAVADSCTLGRNWRWMLASAGIGAGFGIVAGLQRLGQEPARISLDVAVTAGRAAVVFVVLAWLVVVTIRFGRLLRGTLRK